MVLGRVARVFLIVWGLLSGAVPCVAQVDTEIDWRAPSDCPGPEVVRARVAALLSGQAVATRLRASGAIAPSASEGYVLTLAVNVNGHSASRTLRGADCLALTEAGAFLIALAVDPAVAGTQVEGAPEQDREPATGDAQHSGPPASTRDATRAPQPEEATVSQEAGSTKSDSPPLPLSSRAGLFGGVYSLGLPAPVAALGLRAGLGVGHFYAELGVAYLFERSILLGDDGTATFSSQLARLRGCLQWGARLRVLPCAALSLLRTAGEVEGIAAPAPDTALWLAGGVALEVAWLVRAPLELLLDAGIDVPLSARPRFEIESWGTVATGSFVSAHTTLGIGVRY